MDINDVSSNTETLRIVVEANLRSLGQGNSELQDVFIHRDLVLDQVAALAAVVEDSIKLHAQCGKSDATSTREFALLQPAFLRELSSHTHTVARDMQSLNAAAAGGGKLRLQMFSDTFILSLTRSMYRPAADNIDLCAAPDNEFDLRSLNVMKPNFVKMLMHWFLKVVESHAAQKREVTAYIDARNAAETALEDQRNEAAAAKAASAARVAELEASVASLEQQNFQLDGALKAAHLVAGTLGDEKRQLEERFTASENSARTAVATAHAAIASLRAANQECGAKIVEQQAEIAKRGAWLAERDARLAELEARVAQQDAELAARNTELAKYKDLAEARERELAEVTQRVPTETTGQEGKGRPRVTLRYVPQVKVPVPSRGGNRSEGSVSRAPAIPPRVLRSGGALQAHVSASGDEETSGEEDEEDEEEEEDDKNEVDQEMKDPAEVLEAELEETKAKLQAALKKAARLEVELVLARGSPSAASSTSAVPAAPQIPAWLVSANLAALGLLASPNRAKELAQLPQVKVDLPPHQSGMHGAFTRTSIHACLGGSFGGTVVRCTDSATARANAQGISSFLCLRMELNPWLPAGPGRHGYVQTWFDKSFELLRDGESQHVFVGAERWFGYCGLYRVWRADDLTVDEWNMLSLPVKVSYAELTLKNLKKNPKRSGEVLSVRDVFDRYEAGALRLPCVRLECVGFDMQFYQGLVAENDAHQRISIAKVEGSVKRRRVEREDAQEDDGDT